MIKLAIAKIVHRTVLGLPWIPNKYVNTHCTYQETITFISPSQTILYRRNRLLFMVIVSSWCMHIVEKLSYSFRTERVLSHSGEIKLLLCIYTTKYYFALCKSTNPFGTKQ